MKTDAKILARNRRSWKRRMKDPVYKARWNKRSRDYRCHKSTDKVWSAKENLRSAACKLGISIAELILLRKQTRCSVCNCVLRGKGNSKKCIDHCHRTGKVRGVVCQRCNLTLGMIGDSTDGAMKFVEYLKASA